MQGISIFFLAAFAALSSAAAIGGEHLTERSCAGCKWNLFRTHEDVG